MSYKYALHLEHKKQESDFERCKRLCGDVRAIRQEIVEVHAVLGEHVNELNSHLDKISEEGRQAERAIKQNLLAAITQFVVARDVRALADAAIDALRAAFDLHDLLDDDSEQQHEIDRLKRKVSRTSRILKRKNITLERFAKAAADAECICGL